MTIHQRMHRLAVFNAISDGSLTLDRYRRLLQSLLSFHATMGIAAAYSGCAPLGSARQRVALLRSDLRFLGDGRHPHSAAWQLGSRPALLGALYAAEGSMLGGRVIAARLDFLLGSAIDGRRFFTGSRDDGARWRTLLAALETHCASPAARDAAVGGALSAFQLFERCVTREDPSAAAPTARPIVAIPLSRRRGLAAGI